MDRYLKGPSTILPSHVFFSFFFFKKMIIFSVIIFTLLLSLGLTQIYASSPLPLLQLVESTFLWQLHDFHNNEASASDGIHLTAPGLDSVLSVKHQQYAMHCDPIKEEIKLVTLLIVL